MNNHPLAIAFAWLVASASVLLAEPRLHVAAGRSDAIYRANEQVVFVVRLSDSDPAVRPPETVIATWELSADGMAPVRKGEVELKAGEGTIVGSLPSPGFLQCKVAVRPPQAGSSVLTALGAAGVEPEKIGPIEGAPADFDAFWAYQRSELARVPLNVRLTAIAPELVGDARIVAFDVQADSLGGKPVSGYLAYPAGAKAGSLPAILTLHGAGVFDSRLPLATRWAKDGFLALDINAHGLPNGRPKEFYAELAKTTLRDYREFGKEDPSSFYFREMFVRVLRAIDVLAERPEWDGRVLLLHGTSQGGAQAIVGAALDSRVTGLVAGVPAFCDLLAFEAGRPPGWPHLLKPGQKPSEEGARVRETARYFDMVHFAARVRVPTLFTVGFIDTVCPPTSVYAAYNVIPGPKEIFNDPAARHENTPAANARMREALLGFRAARP